MKNLIVFVFIFCFSLTHKGQDPNPNASNNTGNPNPMAGSSVSTTNFTKESIYSEKSITYFGLDLSLMNLLSYSKLGKDQEYLSSLEELVKMNNNTMSESKVKSWFDKKEVKIDESFTSTEFKKYLAPKWIVNQTTSIDPEKIKEHLKNYKTTGTGLGLVIIVELFNETTRNGNMFFVWFDVATKDIVYYKRSYGVQHAGITIEGTWDYSVVDATKYYVDNYFKKKK